MAASHRAVAVYLSDHFAVMALLDVHEEHCARDGSETMWSQRRGAVHALRDQASLLERQENSEAHRLGDEQAAASV